MEDKSKVKNTPIREHFISMDYGQAKENTNKATEWFSTRKQEFFAYTEKSDETPNGTPVEINNSNTQEITYTVYCPENVTVENILAKCNDSKANKWISTDPQERSKILNSFAKLIEKNADLFAEIDICSRGILRKDNKATLPSLVEYLQYYASYTCSYYTEGSTWKPRGVAVAIISDESPLYITGMVLGPALAAGYNIVLQSGNKVTPSVALIVELSVSAGIPEGTIRMIPGEVDIETFFTNNNVEVVSCFDDLYKEKYDVCNTNNKKMITFSSYKLPMIVFENSDLDSACHSLVSAVWSHKGSEPYSVSEVLVQENIFAVFVEKLKGVISKVKTGSAYDKFVDISLDVDTVTLQNYKKVLVDATDLGIDIVKARSISDFAPTAIIGGRVYPNNVISEGNNVPILTVVAFRNINEAVTLANNSKQGFGALVWSENISAVFEVVKKLKVANIWVNTPPLMSADVSFSPYKTSGFSYIGGSEGFYEYVNVKQLQKSDITSAKTSSDTMEKAVSEAKKAQSSWSKLPKKSRAAKLRDAIDTLQTQRKTTSDDTNKKFLDSWISVLHQVLSGACKKTSTPSLPNHSVTSYTEPRGIVVAEVKDNSDVHTKKLIAVAVMEGNAVVLIDSAKNSLYSQVSKVFPSGVCSLCQYSTAVVKAAALHKEVDVYVGETVNQIFSSLPLKDVRKYQTVSNNWDDILRTVTLVKNMWTSVGQSFL